MLDTIAAVLGDAAVGSLTGGTAPIHRQAMVDEFSERRALVSDLKAPRTSETR